MIPRPCLLSTTHQRGGRDPEREGQRGWLAGPNGRSSDPGLRTWISSLYPLSSAQSASCSQGPTWAPAIYLELPAHIRIRLFVFSTFSWNVWCFSALGNLPSSFFPSPWLPTVFTNCTPGWTFSTSASQFKVRCSCLLLGPVSIS